MTDLHYDALIATARLELDRAHRAALATEAGDIRRGLEMAIAALNDAAATPASPGVEPGPDAAKVIAATLRSGLDDLSRGSLSELGNLLESARRDLGC